VVIYGAFVFTQTITHRQYFLHEARRESKQAAAPPGNVALALNSLLLLFCLGAVVLLAENAPSLEAACRELGAPNALVGVIIAAIVLLPEGTRGVARRAGNHLQTSLNLALDRRLPASG
jgi:Ca2+:H+ antiporter